MGSRLVALGDFSFKYRGYLLPIGGFVFGGLAVLFSQHWNDRKIAVAALVACIAITALLYGLGAKFVEL